MKKSEDETRLQLNTLSRILLRDEGITTKKKQHKDKEGERIIHIQGMPRVYLVGRNKGI